VYLQLKVVDLQSPEADSAKTALFSKHPEMEGKPTFIISLYLWPMLYQQGFLLI
jgi:hypothetical protein